MSTIILNPKSISKLANNYMIINRATYNRYQDQLDSILKKAYDLNIKSWNIRYKDDIITDYKVDFRGKEKFNNICEVLKALQKLRYNIDNEAIDYLANKCTVKDLDDIIDCIKNHIISEMEDYNNINYGDI